MTRCFCNKQIEDSKVVCDACAKKLPAMLQLMKQLYKTIPDVHCKGLCQDSCKGAPALPLEAAVIEIKYNVKLALMHNTTFGRDIFFKTMGPNNTQCEFLTEDGKCRIYDDRPFVCRMYGHDLPWISCPHGCTDALKGVITPMAMAFMMRCLLELTPEAKEQIEGRTK